MCGGGGAACEGGGRADGVLGHVATMRGGEMPRALVTRLARAKAEGRKPSFPRHTSESVHA